MAFLTTLMLVTASAHLLSRRLGGTVAQAFCATPRRARHALLLPPWPRRRPPAAGCDAGAALLQSTSLLARGDDAGDAPDGVAPTWTYVPYRPDDPRRPPTRSGAARRGFSSASWTVPDRIPIPGDALSEKFTKASGAGGQNVNKVSTRVELRFHVPTASWLPAEVRERLAANEANRINQEGYLTVTSQEHRTQIQNRKAAQKKLEGMLRDSWARPKVRRMRKGLSKKGKASRKEMKKKISSKKETRRRVDSKDW